MLPNNVYSQVLSSGHYALISLSEPKGVAVINKALFDDLRAPTSTEIAPEIIEVLASYNIHMTNDLASSSIEYTEYIGRGMACWVHVTNACNLACDYCYIHKTPKHMTLETARKIIQSIRTTVTQQGVTRLNMAFAGGEPSLNIPIISFICKALSSQLENVHITFRATTNATNISLEFLKLIETFDFRIYVSLDGIGEYNDARKYKNGKSSYEATAAGLEKLISTIGPKRFSVGIVVSPQNLAGLEQTTAHLLKKGVQFKYSFYRPQKVDPLSFKEYQKELLATLKSCLRIIREDSFHGFNAESVLDKLSVRGEGGDSVCSMGDRYFAIGWDGKISRCHMIQDQPVADLDLDVDILKVLQLQGNPHEPTGTLCKTCDIQKICRTGCRLILDPEGNASIYHDVFLGIFHDYIETIATLSLRDGELKEFY